MRKISLKDTLSGLSNQESLVFLETNYFDKHNRYSYLFQGPLKVISCYNTKMVEPSLNSIEQETKKGLFAAGFVSYEAGFAFEAFYNKDQYYDFPLVGFGIFDQPVIFDHKCIEFYSPEKSDNFKISDIKPSVSEREYIDSIKKIKRYIEQGNTYQVNRTFKLDFAFKGNPFDIYSALRTRQGVAYSAFIKLGNKVILSFSPELFFRKQKDLIQVKPMKGTIGRGRFQAEDACNANILYNCPKNRSENIMILDLLRNDIGKISRPGTVKAKTFFNIEKYESLFQMTSTAEGVIRPGVSTPALFNALFPSGSVTGAPKIRTMQIINEIEKSPRRIYTGGIGFIGPDNSSVFNVAIRTLLLDINAGKGEMGIGSGIVYDSDPKTEYEECMLKARFLDSQKDFKLIETVLWDPEKGYRLLDLHRQRLSESASYFSYKFDYHNVSRQLKRVSKSFSHDKRYRVRLLLSKGGGLEISYSEINDSNILKAVVFSSKQTNSNDRWLYHKTTNRMLYDSEHARYSKLGFFDVIFKNEKGQVTEGAISNIFIKKKKVYYTPPIECGVLNGVYRRHALLAGKLYIREKILYPEDIHKADSIFISNAVKGMVSVQLHENSVSAQSVKANRASTAKRECIYA